MLETIAIVVGVLVGVLFVLWVLLNIVVHGTIFWFCHFFTIDVLALSGKDGSRKSMAIIAEKIMEAYRLLGHRGVRLMSELGFSDESPIISHFARLRDAEVMYEDGNIQILVMVVRIKIKIPPPFPHAEISSAAAMQRKRAEELESDYHKLVRMTGWPLSVMTMMYR